MIKIQDFNRVVSSVVAVAQGPDGKPALLAENRPAWDYRAFTYTGTDTFDAGEVNIMYEG
jgi:hypothetical protein